MRAGDQVMAAGRRRAWQQFVICAIGGGTGAALLLITGEGVFEAVVPWLIAFASLTLFVSPRLKKLSSGTERWRIYLCSLFFVCLYGGYFGAGAGVVYFALVLLLTSYPWPRAVLMKSVLLSISNLIATVIFVIFAPIDWLAALILFAGNLDRRQHRAARSAVHPRSHQPLGDRDRRSLPGLVVVERPNGPASTTRST